MNQPPPAPPRSHHPPRRRAPPGAAPGTLIADPHARPSVVRVMAYGPDAVEEHTPQRVDEIRAIKGRLPVTWISVQGLADTGMIAELGDMFGLHRLALEDVVNAHQRPKVEEFEDHLFLVMRIPHVEARLRTEQVSVFVGPDFLLTFEERAGAGFDPVRERIRTSRGRIRTAGCDYLAYALLDAGIDSYFPLLERYGESIEAMEGEVFAHPDVNMVPHIHALRRDVLTVRRAVWPQREMLNALIRDDSALISEHTRVYLRDCADHTFQLLDLIETYRETATDLVDIYLSSVSTRMNEIMQVLTVIATIFMPLTVITGIYGMNFDRSSPLNMPELGWYWGYPLTLLLMAAVAAGMVLYFYRKGWIGSAKRKVRRRAERGRRR